MATRPLARIAALTVLAILSALSCDSGTGPTRSEPSLVQIVSGHEQVGTVGEELPNPLVVRVVDARGRPVAGQVVNFVVVEGGGSVFAGAALTNSSGTAQERWTLGTVAKQPQRVEVRAVDSETGRPIVFATFTATADPGPATALVANGATTRDGPVGSALASPLSVTAHDRYGNAVPNVGVTWTVVAGAGTLAPVAPVTDADGHATATWTLGTALDVVHRAVGRLTAAPAIEVAFQATATLPPTVTFSKSGDGQVVEVGATAPDSLTVTVRLADGRAVPGVTVDWTADVGATLTSTGGVTGVDGRVGTKVSPGTVARTVNVHARIMGFDPIAFTVVARPSTAFLQRVSGHAQTGDLGELLPQPLVVRATDTHNNVVPGVVVEWEVQRGGGSVTAARDTTDANGLASVRWQLGTVLDSTHTAVARIVGSSHDILFSAQPSLPTTATLVKISGDAQTDTVQQRLPQPLVVELRLRDGRPVSGAEIRWTPSRNGAVSPGSVDTTDGGGRSSVEWTLDWSAIPQQLTAQAVLGPSVQFTATGLPDAPTVIQRWTGDAQLGTAGRELTDSIKVVVTDRHGNPVGGVPVQWTVESGGGTVAPGGATTGTGGFASASWTLGSAAEAQTVAATIAGPATVRFTARLATRFAQVSAGHLHSCGIGESGATYCWGFAYLGGLGNGVSTETAYPSPVRVATTLRFVTVSAGNHATCALTAEGEAFCWGSNTSGGVGDGMGRNVSSPVAVAGGRRYKAIATDGHSCAIGLDDVAYCWGSNRFGQLGSASLLQCPSGNIEFPCTLAPEPVTGGHRFTKIDPGANHTCGIAADGVTYCWGRNGSGELGNGGGAGGPTPTPVAGGHQFVDISASGEHTCGIRADGAAYCWGLSRQADGTHVAVTMPVKVDGVPALADITAGMTLFACARAADDRVFCWGNSANGQLGNPNVGTGAPPGLVGTFKSVSAGRSHACAINRDNLVYCWGLNDGGQSGGADERYLEPHLIPLPLD